MDIAPAAAVVRKVRFGATADPFNVIALVDWNDMSVAEETVVAALMLSVPFVTVAEDEPPFNCRVPAPPLEPKDKFCPLAGVKVIAPVVLIVPVEPPGATMLAAVPEEVKLMFELPPAIELPAPKLKVGVVVVRLPAAIV
jgi:hypothetical protein